MQIKKTIPFVIFVNLIVFLLPVLFFCGIGDNLKTYPVHRTADHPISIDGILEDDEWQGALVLTDFRFPWLDTATPYTEFRALYSDSNFYFVFQVNDTDIVLAENFETEMDVLNEDRVEIFMSQDRELKQYYALEIDALGRVMDTAARFHRKFDRSWRCTGLRTSGVVTKGGYVVEGLIPVKTLKEIGVLDESDTIHAGIFRGEFHYSKSSEIIQHWISWIDLRMKAPDFHVPGAFGLFKFTDKTIDQ